jgi:cyclic dehypoxanthinyl futalosine synthase
MGISREQALDCFKSDDLIGIGMEADAVRRQLHPEGVVSYAMERVVSCAARELEAIFADIDAAEAMGATGLVLDLGATSFDWAVRLIAEVKRGFPSLWLRGFSAAQIEASGISVEDAIGRLLETGLDSIGGAQPEIADEIWLKVHRAAHRAGLWTAARIVFGAGETIAERLDRLEAIRLLQGEIGGFAAIAPVSYHAVGGRELDETTAVEYLKTLAVARIYLDNIENVEADWTTQGLKALQMGLRFGANDVGAVQVERAKGATEEELRRVIRDAGFRPVQREMGYRAMLVG